VRVVVVPSAQLTEGIVAPRPHRAIAFQREGVVSPHEMATTFRQTRPQKLAGAI